MPPFPRVTQTLEVLLRACLTWFSDAVWSCALGFVGHLLFSQSPISQTERPELPTAPAAVEAAELGPEAGWPALLSHPLPPP